MSYELNTELMNHLGAIARREGISLSKLITRLLHEAK